MIIKNISGQILVETRHRTLKETLEHCAKNGIYLGFANIRNRKIKYANLDGLIAPNAFFWGCDFTGSDMGFGDFKGADFRASNFDDVCLTQTDLCQCDFRGASFSRTLMDNAVFDGAKISCPSFWKCDVTSIQSMNGLVFLHKGEQEIMLSDTPFILKHKNASIVFLNDFCLWNNNLFPAGLIPLPAAKDMFGAKTQIERMLNAVSQNANRPMPKIHRG